MSNISSQSWLNFLWSLHNDVRNARGVKLTGMGALNEINNYLLLFFIEREFDEYCLSDDCKLSYMYKEFCTDEKIKEDTKSSGMTEDDKKKKNYWKLWNHWCNINSMECVLRKLAKSMKIQKYIKNEVTAICAFTDNCETGKTIQNIISKIYKIFAKIVNSDDPKDVMNVALDTFGFDAFGDAYEKFKQQSCEDSGKTTGQHFTPEIIKSYSTSELKPKSTEIFYEPACGTGGFIHHNARYVKDHEGMDAYKVFTKNLMANECNPEIYKPLGINMLIHGIPIEHIRKQDSLDLTYWANSIKDSVDVIATNPPFGGSDTVTPDPYWGPLKTGKNVIKDSMGQFMMHIYQSLKKGGRCGTVADRGIIKNGSDSKTSWQSKLRKFLLENTNLYRIVLLPKNTFEYTGFSTCMLFFVKGEKTKQVEFRELKIKDIIKDGMKANEIESETILGTVTFDQIKEKNYSLDPDDYFKVVEIKDTKYWIKLGDICELNIGGTPLRKESTYWNNGNNIWVSIADLNNGLIYDSKEKISDDGVKNSSVKLIKEGSILMSFKLTIGKMGIAGKDMYCNEAIMFFKHDNDITNKYLYYWLKHCINNYVDNNICKTGGIGNGSLNKLSLNNIQIPKLSLEHQQEIVTFLDEQFKRYDINKLNKQIPLFDLLINKNYVLATELLYLTYRQILVNQELENIKHDAKAMFMVSVHALDAEMKKLGDIVEINPDNKHKYQYINYIDIGSIENHKIINIQKIDKDFPSRAKRVINMNDIIISSVRPNLEKISVIDFEKDNLICSTGFYVIRCEKNVNYKYIYELLKSNDVTQYLVNNCGGNLYPAFNQNALLNLQIPVPSLEIQEQIVKKIETLNDKSSHYTEYAKCLQEELDLACETIKNMTANGTQPKIEEQQNELNVNTDEEEQNTEENKDEPNNDENIEDADIDEQIDKIEDIIKNDEIKKTSKKIIKKEEPLDEAKTGKKKIIKSKK